MMAQRKHAERQRPVIGRSLHAANDNVRPRTRSELAEEIASLTLGGLFSAAVYALVGYAIWKGITEVVTW